MALDMQLLIEGRALGIVKNYAPVTRSVTYATQRTGTPGKLTIEMLKGHDADFSEGDGVNFSVNGTPIFHGFVFTKSLNRWGELKVVAYDQLRYLKAKESYLFQAEEVGAMITKIASDFQLKTGTLESTGYPIPSYVKENKTCLDIISGAVQLTTYGTGKVYIFYDDNGGLALRLAENLMSATLVGTGSLLTDYTYKTDIDSDTYNRIKLVRPNEETGRTDVYLFQDSDTIATWGTLQYYSQVDEEMNTAQITEQGNTMLAYYNRVLKTLTIESLGVLGIRAGSMLMLNIPELGSISTNKFVLLDSATHNFSQNTHTMKLITRAL